MTATNLAIALILLVAFLASAPAPRTNPEEQPAKK